MILSCNSCEKKFVLPDNAIGASGRLVQCSACGNKWKQFPIIVQNNEKQKFEFKAPQLKKSKIQKTKKETVKKRKGPDLYTPEYLAKKHGIAINGKQKSNNKTQSKETNVKFGFYNFLLVLTLFLTFIIRIIYFTKDKITQKFPFLENYIYYIFESIKNIKEIIINFFSTY